MSQNVIISLSIVKHHHFHSIPLVSLKLSDSTYTHICTTPLGDIQTSNMVTMA